MDLASAIRAVVATLRTRPGDLLPFYVLGLAVPAIVRVVAFAGGFALIAYLFTTGRVAMFREELAVVDTDPPDPDADPEAFTAWAESLQPLVETVVTPTSVALVFVTILTSLLLGLLLVAAVTAGQMAACFARLRQERGLVEGIRGFRAYWRPFLGVYLLELLLWAIVTMAAVIAIGVAFLIWPPLAVFVGIFAILFWVAAVVVIRALFAFAPAAIVVHDASTLGSLRGSFGFIRAEFMGAVSYYVVAAGVLLGMGGVSSTLAAIGSPSVTAIASFLVVAPALDLLKTTFYGEHRGAIRPPESPEVGVIEQTERGFRHGVAEMSRFVKDTPGLHALSLGTLVVGIAMGWVVAGPFVGEIDASIRQRSAGFFPPTAALELFGNNFTVAMATAFSGVAAGIPAAVGIWFNGLSIGVLSRLEVALIELVAFVIPHGIFEIPALLISGGVGFYLGIHTWRTWRGRGDRRSLAGALERCFWVLMGVGLLLVVAALIEGFFSPWYFRLFL